MCADLGEEVVPDHSKVDTLARRMARGQVVGRVCFPGRLCPPWGFDRRRGFPRDQQRDGRRPTARCALETPTQATYKRFYGSRLLNPERYAADFSKTINEILQPLAGVDGTQLEARVEVTAVNPTGSDEPKRRTVSENAETLRFEPHGFEEL
jgi:hypothetical protein